MELDQTLNWFVTHWYYWLILILVLILYKWYSDLERLKKQFTHFCEERLKTKIKDETVINPKPKNYRWLAKEINVTGEKLKLMGLVKSFNKFPINNSKDEDFIVSIVVATRFFKWLRLSLGNNKMFQFNLKSVKIDEDKHIVIIPYHYYFTQHPDGHYILVSPNVNQTFKMDNDEIDRDLKRLAIDGFASQMASYSSVKPTWGHEDNVMAKEQEMKFGFLDKFGRKKPSFEETKKEED